ncbi:hypothetical protein EOM89_04415 [Candidatus Falkowbacteria bacterium]|nr:hypothetical protein [Candidatus Falkowbacteria bacterium]
MSTFQEVDDTTLVTLIDQAQRRIVLLAPGVFAVVAQALGRRLAASARLQVTVIIDPEEDVCRIGYGDAVGLELLSRLASEYGFALMAQPGLRVGVLLVDDVTLVWSPTPRSVEAAPRAPHPASAARAPNGVILGADPGAQLARAVAAPETPTLTPAAETGVILGANPGEQQARAGAAHEPPTPLPAAEIGVRAVTPAQVRQTLEALNKNPPIPVDLACITRVFSTKLQFVEFKVTGGRFSKRELKVANNYMNADIQGELKGLIESRLRAFGDYRDEEVAVPAFNQGEEVFDRHQNRLTEKVSEASLHRQRIALERRFLYTIPGFGRLMAKDDKGEFEKLVTAFRKQLEAHSHGIRQHLATQVDKIIAEAVALIQERAARTGLTMEVDDLKEEIRAGLSRAQDEAPEVKLIFKDVTYEQTKNPAFRAKVNKALPAAKRKQLGNWNQDFEAAKAVTPGPQAQPGLFNV